jgi:hypothetical protein
MMGKLYYQPLSFNLVSMKLISPVIDAITCSMAPCLVNSKLQVSLRAITYSRSSQQPPPPPPPPPPQLKPPPPPPPPEKRMKLDPMVAVFPRPKPAALLAPRCAFLGGGGDRGGSGSHPQAALVVEQTPAPCNFRCDHCLRIID